MLQVEDCHISFCQQLLLKIQCKTKRHRIDVVPGHPHAITIPAAFNGVVVMLQKMSSAGHDTHIQLYEIKWKDGDLACCKSLDFKDGAAELPSVLDSFIVGFFFFLLLHLISAYFADVLRFHGILREMNSPVSVYRYEFNKSPFLFHYEIRKGNLQDLPRQLFRNKTRILV